MPVLLIARHEAFAQGIAAGLSFEKAHVKAGYKRHRSNAAALAHKHHIEARVAELIEQRNQIDRKALKIATKNLAISKTRVLEEFAWVAFSSPENYIEYQDGRACWKKWSDLNSGLMGAVERVHIDKDGNVTYKLPTMGAKLEALGKVGTELGMFINRSDNKHSFEKRFSQLPPEERRAVADDLMDQAQEILKRHKMIEAEAHEVVDGED